MRILTAMIVCVVLAGCQPNLPAHQPTTRPVVIGVLTDPTPQPEVNALVTPPVGWKSEPLEKSKDHTHQVWVSPTGKTAYGVIHFGIPLPMSASFLLGPFLDNMRKEEGRADLIGQPTRDDALPGVRFVVEGSVHRMRINLIARGWKAWAVYAGTLIAQPEAPEELELAERAREATKVGVK
jgi:hypothetical protein